MRRFTLETAAFAAIQVLIAASALALLGVSEDDYFAATIDKHRRLELAAAPRIVLVGGSNLAFGVVSPRMEERLGYAVVNMALHACVGMDFMLREVEGQLRPGDIVVISLEYEHFTRDMTNDSEPVLFQVLRARPTGLKRLGWPQASALLDSGLNYVPWQAKIRIRDLLREPQGPRPPYTRSSFNAHGDVTAHYRVPGNRRAAARLDPSVQTPVIAAGPARRMNEFADACASRGVRVFYAHAPIPRRAYLRWHGAIERLVDASLRDLRIPVINTPAEAVYPDDLFHDTRYHLTRRGAELRTDDLAGRLAPFLEGRLPRARPAGAGPPIDQDRSRR